MKVVNSPKWGNIAFGRGEGNLFVQEQAEQVLFGITVDYVDIKFQPVKPE